MNGKEEPSKAECSPQRERTVGDVLDANILECRERLERACVRKAKAECLNILDHPADFYESLMYQF